MEISCLYIHKYNYKNIIIIFYKFNDNIFIEISEYYIYNNITLYSNRISKFRNLISIFYNSFNILKNKYKLLYNFYILSKILSFKSINNNIETLCIYNFDNILEYLSYIPYNFFNIKKYYKFNENIIDVTHIINNTNLNLIIKLIINFQNNILNNLEYEIMDINNNIKYQDNLFIIILNLYYIYNLNHNIIDIISKYI